MCSFCLDKLDKEYNAKDHCKDKNSSNVNFSKFIAALIEFAVQQHAINDVLIDYKQPNDRHYTEHSESWRSHDLKGGKQETQLTVINRQYWPGEDENTIISDEIDSIMSNENIRDVVEKIYGLR